MNKYNLFCNNYFHVMCFGSKSIIIVSPIFSTTFFKQNTFFSSLVIIIISPILSTKILLVLFLNLYYNNHIIISSYHNNSLPSCSPEQPHILPHNYNQQDLLQLPCNYMLMHWPSISSGIFLNLHIPSSSSYTISVPYVLLSSSHIRSLKYNQQDLLQFPYNYMLMYLDSLLFLQVTFLNLNHSNHHHLHHYQQYILYHQSLLSSFDPIAKYIR